MTTDQTVPRLNVHVAEWQPMPEYGGHQAILYRSEDRTRLAGTFKESGTHAMTMPFDEFVYVVDGSVKVTVAGGDSFSATRGDFFFVRKGMDVTWDMSTDFHQVAVLVSDTPID